MREMRQEQHGRALGDFNPRSFLFRNPLTRGIRESSRLYYRPSSHRTGGPVVFRNALAERF
jgi:hypothetical protein